MPNDKRDYPHPSHEWKSDAPMSKCRRCGAQKNLAVGKYPCKEKAEVELVKLEDPPTIYGRPIQEHGGGKYLRTIHSADGKGNPIKVDVYCVIKAFGVTCPARQHAIKKLLCAGLRGKGDELADLHGVFDAMWRAVELHKQEQADNRGVKE